MQLDSFGYSTSTFFVLTNGSSFGYFTSSRGVRLGCLVSHLLFIIVMEASLGIMDKDAQLGLFSGFVVSFSSVIVNHLHYAEDTIFFIDHNKEEFHKLFYALKCFEFIVGLKVNTRLDS